ncbi:MAG: hypothetical protein GQ581_00275 [Methyloprofundus sp.]|nr:hypothetical protein [Methyloprofundus sp.]
MNASILNGVSAIAAGNETEGLIANSTGQGESGADFLASFATQMHAQEHTQVVAGSAVQEQGSALEKIVGLIGEQDRQNVAALLGESLPSIQKNIQLQDINLDETMAALQDILGGLDSVDTQANAVLQNLADTVAEVDANAIPTPVIELLGEQLGISPVEENSLQEVTAVLESAIPEQPIDISSTDSALAINLFAEVLTETSVVKGATAQLDSQPVVNSLEDTIDEDVLAVTNFIAPPQMSSNVADIKLVAENVVVAMPQMLRRQQTNLEKIPSVQSALVEAEINEGLDPKTGASNIMRDNLLSTSSNIMDTVVDKISTKAADLPTTATQALGEQVGQKFSIADLSTLSRQVENTAPKQELPAMTKAFNHPEWKQEFNERIIWMHNKAIPSAELRLNPQHLGPISIQINIDKDQQASILFNAQNAGVREAIEAALPKLKDMLGSQQVTLAEASVSQQGQDQGNARQAMQDALQDRKQNNGNSSLAQEARELEVNDIAEEITQGRAVASKGLLSLYA